MKLPFFFKCSEVALPNSHLIISLTSPCHYFILCYLHTSTFRSLLSSALLSLFVRLLSFFFLLPTPSLLSTILTMTSFSSLSTADYLSPFHVRHCVNLLTKSIIFLPYFIFTPSVNWTVASLPWRFPYLPFSSSNITSHQYINLHTSLRTRH